MMEIKHDDVQYIANTYARYDLLIEHGNGAICYDETGKEYIDLGSGIGVNSLGYCNPDWVDAVTEQLKKLQHCSNLYYSIPDVQLAKMLCERTGMKKVFFANSGAEANECAIKVARKYSHDHYSPDRSKIITLQNSFHGRTAATLSATGQDVFHRHFFPFPEGFVSLPANDADAIIAAMDETCCAVMIELVQGEGGVIALDRNFVTAIWEECQKRDILLIVDEVQTGIGRTGTLCCYEQYGIKPNLVTLAKGLGGGLPIGACMFDEKVQATMGFSDHGSTFGGNPIACAGAVNVLEQLDDNLLKEVNEKSAYIRERLSNHPAIESVTGLGMMVGIALKDGITASDAAKRCIQNGVIVLTAKTKLRLLPPLNIPIDVLEKALDRLELTLNEF